MDLQSSIDKAYADLDLESKIDSAYTDIEQQDAADRAAAASDLMGIGYTQEDIDRKPGFTATSTLGKVAEALPAKVAAGGMEAARSALSLANFIPAVNRTRRYMAQAIKEEVDPYGTTGNWLADSALEAVKSTTQSLTNMAMFGGVGGLLGAIAGKGLLFGTNEYADFIDEVKDIAVKQGLSDAEVSKRLADARIPGIISGLAEMGGEWASDFVGAKLLGLTGKVVKEPVKKLLARGAGAWGAEVLGEEGTTAAQHYARQAAELQTESLAKEMIDTLGVAGIQAGMMIPMGAGVARRRRAQLTDTLTDMGVEPEAAKQKAAEVFSVAETQGQSAAEKVLWDTIEEQKQKAPERTVITSVIDKLIADSAEPGRVAVEGMLARPVTEQEESSMMPIDDFYDDYTDALRVQQEVQVLGREFGLSKQSTLFDYTDAVSRVEEIKEHAKSLRGNERQLPVRGTISEEGQNKGSEDIQLTEEQREEGVQTSAEQQAQGNVAQTKEVIASAEEESKAEGQTQTEVLTQRPVSQGGAMPHLDKLAQALFEDDLTGVIAPNKEAAQQIVEKAGADRFQMTMHGADYVVLPIGSTVGKKEKAAIRRAQANYIKEEVEVTPTIKEEPEVDYTPMSPADIQAGLKADADTNEGLLQQLTAKVDNWFRGKRNGAGYQDLYAEVEGWIDTAKNSKWKGQFIDVLRRLELAREAAGNPDQLTRLLMDERGFVDFTAVMDLSFTIYDKVGGKVKEWWRAMKAYAGEQWNRVKPYVYMAKQVLFNNKGQLYIANILNVNRTLDGYSQSLVDAQMAERTGIGADEIFRKTGWQHIKDWWFWQLDTSGARIDFTKYVKNGTALDSILSLPELYSRFPDMRNVTVLFDNMRVSSGYNAGTDTITIGAFGKSNDIKLQESLWHEVQHAIQSRQGIAVGSSPLAEMKRITLDSINEVLGAVDVSIMPKRDQVYLSDAVGDIEDSTNWEIAEERVNAINELLEEKFGVRVHEVTSEEARAAYRNQLGEVIARYAGKTSAYTLPSLPIPQSDIDKALVKFDSNKVQHSVYMPESKRSIHADTNEGLLQEPNFRDCLSLGIMEYGQSGGNVKQWLRAMKNRLQSVWNRVRNYVYMVRHIVFDQDAYVSIAVPFQTYGQGSMFFTTPDKSFSLPNYTYSLYDAIMMRDSGMSDADVLAKTGFQKIHKWWFYRLPTDDVPINWSALRSTGRARLSDMVDIPELYNRIPDAANVTVVADPYIAVGNGFYDHSVREIHIGFTPGVQYSYQLPLIHELNHVVQNFQGTATGSSPLREYWKMATTDMVSVGARLGALQDIINSMSKANTKEAIDKIIDKFNKELTRLGMDTISMPQWSDALNAYNKQLGEIMANIGMYGDINEPLILNKGYLVRVTGRGTDYEVLPEPNRLHISARIADTTDALEQGQMRKQDAIAANSTIIDKRPKDINAITPWFRHSWFAASSDIAKRLVFSITNAEKLYNVRVQNELDMKDNITKHLTKEERHQVMTLGNAVSRDMKKLRKLLKDNEVDNIDEVMQEFKDWTIEQYAPSAKIAAVYSTIDKTIYQRYRKMIKANLMRELRFHTNPQFVAAIDNYAALVQQGVDDVTALLTAMTSNIAQDPVQYKKFGAVLADYIDQAKAISEWGDDDYWSHFMRGSLVLKNKDGKIVTVAVTPDQAAARIQEYADGHPDQGPYTMDDSFIYTDSLPTLVGRRHYLAIRNRLANAIKTVNSEMGRAEAQQKVGLALRRVLGTKPASVFAGPLLTARNVLPGEEDIDVVLSTYIQIVTKKLTYDPVIWQVRRDVGQLPRNERQHVEDVLASAKGVYDQIERAFDDFVRLLFPNTKGRNLSRAVSNSRTVTAALKLGYRPIASVLNGLDATARIWIEHHEQAMARGMAWMATPEGKQIVDKYSWALGARPFEEAGHFKGGIRFLGHNYKGWMQVATPLGMYNIAEFPARKLNFAVAYTQYMSDVKGATEEAAADFAIRSVDMLQGANVISALPKLMRNPVGRAFTLFMPFVVRTVEWMAANINNPQFWGRFLPYMLAVGGPRGIAMMLKSLPFWALLSVFMGSDRLEEWYLSIDEWLQRKLGGAASGLPGLAGIDIVAPATIQLPTQPDQWAGAVVSTLLKGSMQATQAIFDYNRAAELKDIAKRQAPFIRNYWDVIDAIIDDYGNVWDVNGNIKYNLYNNYDRVVVAAGAKPVTKAYEETATRLNKMAVRRENKVKDDILDWATNQLVVMTRRGFTSSDLPDSFYAKLLDRMAAHNITVDSLTSRLNESQQAKGLGMVLSSPKLYRIAVYNRLEEAGNTFNTNFLQPQR